MDVKRLLKQTRLYQTLNHWRRLMLYTDYRRYNKQPRINYRQFCYENGGLGLRQDLRPQGIKLKTALIVSQFHPPFAAIEAFMMKAMQMAGFQTVVMGNRRYDILRYGWLAGNKMVIEPSDFKTEDAAEWVDQQLDRLSTLHDWLNLEYQGVHVGRFAVATTMRHLKLGNLDFSKPDIRARLRVLLEYSVLQTLRTKEILKEIKPDCVLGMDRGYSVYGEVFDLALSHGIDALTWNLGYKSNCLYVKRYHSGNERDHPLTPSAESWQQLVSIPWKPEYGHEVRQEIFQCYKTEDWFSVVGTQFDKKILSRQMTRQMLGLSSDRKVAVIFPHILWDGSFFSGTDLFDNYTQWFVETIRAACANSRLQWVVKLHPAHLVKAKQGNDTGRPAELTAIEEVGSLPDHVKLVFPDTGLSTYSLFEIADYAVTVRGTVGMEAALFGVPVVTGGTGRYDRRGFTLDSNSREEYLHKLETLETYPRLSKEQIELAERYAYGVFFCRPLRLSSISLEYLRDEVATPKVTVHCQTRQQWLESPDMRKLAAWLTDGKAEDMWVSPTKYNDG
jgi:hypothetical protein